MNVNKHLDMRGVQLQVGDVIVYGRSNRNYPINMGKVIGFEEGAKYLGKETYNILIKGNNALAISRVPSFHSSRVLVLPKEYGEVL